MGFQLFSRSQASSSGNTNPEFIRGAARLSELREAVQGLSALTQTCIDLAETLKKDLGRTPQNVSLHNNLQDSQQALREFVKLCQNNDGELKCFTNYYRKDYPKSDSKSGMVKQFDKEAYLNNEVRRRGEFVQTLAGRGAPVAIEAGEVLERACRQAGRGSPPDLVDAVQELDKLGRQGQ